VRALEQEDAALLHEVHVVDALRRPDRVLAAGAPRVVDDGANIDDLQ
jgi:hypothetical protein